MAYMTLAYQEGARGILRVLRGINNKGCDS